MSITTYPGLLVELQRMITGDDALATEIPSDTLADIVLLAERKVYRDVRSRHNEKAFAALTVTNNLAPIPDDWESTSTIHFGKSALRPKPEDWMRERLQRNPTGACLYFAEAGASFYFMPAVADATAVQGRYFFRFPALSADTIAANTLYQQEPDLFLYAALAESGEFFPVGNRLQIWESKYQRIKDTVNNAKSRAAYSGGRIQRTASTSLIG